MRKQLIVVGVIWVLPPAGVVWTLAAPLPPTTRQGDTAPATSSAPATLVLDPTRYLADPSDHQSALRRARGAIEEVVAAGGEALDKAQTHLALANWHLAVPPARPATRWLIGLETKADLETIRASAAEAHEHLGCARRLLESEEAKKLQGQAKARRRELAKAADVLKSFADLLAEAATPADTEAGRSAWVEVAVGLSATRESGQESVAAAALLWQSFAWEQAGRRDRALESLPDALATPQRLPYDFFCRLLRCRILADGGQHTAALVLSTKILEASRRWFAKPPRPILEARLRLVALLQCRLSRVWMDRFGAAADETGSADALRAALARRYRELFGNGQETVEVYCLEAAIPMLPEARATGPLPPTTAPGPRTSTSSPVSRPATSPASDEAQPVDEQEPTNAPGGAD